MIKKITSIFLVSTLLCNVSTLSVLAQNGNTLLNAEKSTQTKIDKYPPDIPLMHEISFLDGQITPDVHFVGKNNKKGIFVFFYKHFRDLKNLYYKSLENKLNEKWYISDLKEDYLKWANGTSFEEQNKNWWDFDLSWNSIRNSGKSFLGLFNYSKEHHDKVSDLLLSNRHLNRKIRRGDDFRFPGILAVDKNSAEIDDFYLYDDFNSETMQEISSIIKSNNTVQAKLSDLNDLVDRKYEDFRKFKREDTIYDTIAFCYHLNRLNDYLSNFEDDWNHKSLEERKEIRKLRDKINSLVPNYCFLTEKNKAPFANIDVELSKYKVVTDTKDIKRIYVERTYIPQFIEDLIKSVDSKYTNSKGEYNFDVVKGENVLKLASEVHATKHQDILNALGRQLDKSKERLKKKYLDIGIHAARATKSVLRAIPQNGILNLAITGASENDNDSSAISITKEEACNYLAEYKPELLKDFTNLPISTGENVNNQALVEFTDKVNLDETKKSDFYLAIKEFIEHETMDAELKREIATFEAYKSKTEHDISFLDTTKLLIQFSRDQYMNNDFEAIIIEEDKKYEVPNDVSSKKLSEYSIKKIQRMDEK